MADGVDGVGGGHALVAARRVIRRWPDHVKAQIVAESFQPGVRVVDVARRHGLVPQQVSDWRRAARRGFLAVPAQVLACISRSEPPEPVFAPLAVMGEREASPVSRVSIDVSPHMAGVMTVEVDGDVVVRIPGDVPVGRAAALVRALRGIS